MGYVYGWGASVVMIGALFKLEHLKGSGVLLSIGLITEAFIFFLSAFEPPLELPEWSRVYPELSEDYDPEIEKPGKKGKKGFEDLFETNDLTPELLDKVGKGLSNLSNTARGISDITSATLATDMYVKNMGSASESMGSLAETNQKANAAIQQSVGSLMNSYSSTAQKISESGIEALENLKNTGEKFSTILADTGKKLADTYHHAGNSVSAEIENIKDSSKQYSAHLQKLNGNLNTLNTSFEAQIKGTEEQFIASQNFSKELMAMNAILASSMEELKKYKENAEQLNKHLESLNTIYGNMLGAMSYKK